MGRADVETVWDAFTHQMRRDPAVVAISGEASFTYSEAGERAQIVAKALAEYAEPGSLVALDAAGPAAGAIAFLAAAQANCALMPLNADGPPKYRATLVGDAGARVLLREREGHILTVESMSGIGTGAAPRWPATLEGVAYVLYTSGSTGRPKGVAVSHQALLRRLRGLAQVPGFHRGESFLAMTALSFDISIAEMLLPLTTGGRVIAAPAAARLDPAVFASFAAGHRPDVIQATPSYWRLALARGWQGAPGSRLWCGGEALTPGLASRLLRAGDELWNMYGPTEATIWASAARISSEAAVGLGSPLAGSGLCLSDETGHLVISRGEPGEILLYGDGLALGYVNQQELTARRFRVRETPDGPKLCYQTGDRARYRDDGVLEFLGRADDQVKLRGHRIELGELEAVMEEHPAVHEAVAVLQDAASAENRHIAAFVTGEAGMTARQLREWLAERLPPSIRPSRIRVVPSLPRTAAGKIDRVSLANGSPDGSTPI